MELAKIRESQGKVAEAATILQELQVGVCVRVCVRACVRACVRVRVRVFMCTHACEEEGVWVHSTCMLFQGLQFYQQSDKLQKIGVIWQAFNEQSEDESINSVAYFECVTTRMF